MAKNMARIENGTVVNLQWCSNRASETDTLKDLSDRFVEIGDTYENGKFFHEGVEILTPLEEARNRVAELETRNADQAAALAAIYQGVTQ